MFNKPLIRIVDDDDALRDALLYTVESEGWEAAPILMQPPFSRATFLRGQALSFSTSGCRA